MLTVIFYNTDSGNAAAAKMRSREIASKSKGSYVSMIDVGFWDGSPLRYDVAEIFTGVPGWQRKEIAEAFQGREVVNTEDVISQELEEAHGHGDVPDDPDADLDKAAEPSNKKAVHKGGGRWFVMVGDERLSGPHDKAEATRLAGE